MLEARHHFVAYGFVARTAFLRGHAPFMWPSPFPTLLDPCQGIVCAEYAVVMQLRRLPRRSDRRAVPLAVMNKASTRPEEYAIDIGITTSERIDVIIRVGRDPASAADWKFSKLY